MMTTINNRKLALNSLLQEGPVTVLKVDNDQFNLEIFWDIDSQDRTLLEAGNINTILKRITHEPAEAVELEYAIADIEDQLMPIINDLPKHRCLVTSEQVFWEIAEVAGNDSEDKHELDVDAVEEVFNRLVDVAYGTPASRLDVPENREFAATVLFLRELMHHAGFNTIILRY